MEIPYAAAGNDVKAPDAPGDDPAAPVDHFAQKYSRLSASDLARVVSLQARFRGNARRARLMKSRLSSAHAAGGARDVDEVAAAGVDADVVCRPFLEGEEDEVAGLQPRTLDGLTRHHLR